MLAEQSLLRGRAKRAYEWGRLWHALAGSIPTKSDSPTAVFLSAAATALLTGAIGSSCVGLHGIVGMALGIGLGAVPQALRFVARR